MIGLFITYDHLIRSERGLHFLIAKIYLKCVGKMEEPTDKHFLPKNSHILYAYDNLQLNMFSYAGKKQSEIVIKIAFE